MSSRREGGVREERRDVQNFDFFGSVGDHEQTSRLTSDFCTLDESYTLDRFLDASLPPQRRIGQLNPPRRRSILPIPIPSLLPLSHAEGDNPRTIRVPLAVQLLVRIGIGITSNRFAPRSGSRERSGTRSRVRSDSLRLRSSYGGVLAHRGVPSASRLFLILHRLRERFLSSSSAS